MTYLLGFFSGAKKVADPAASPPPCTPSKDPIFSERPILDVRVAPVSVRILSHKCPTNCSTMEPFLHRRFDGLWFVRVFGCMRMNPSLGPVVDN